MPFVIILVGILAIVSVVQGTYKELGNEVVTDLAGSAGNIGYIYWVSSIVAVGAIGYYSPLQKFSRLFMFLIILGMILSNQGLFAKIQQALKSGPQSSGANSGDQINAAQVTQSIGQSMQTITSIGETLALA